MLKIETSIDPGLFVFRVSGPLSGQAIAQAIQEHHRSIAGRGCLWDLRQADFSTLIEGDFPKISGTAQRASESKRITRVAYVVADGRAYVTMCKYMMHTVNSRVPLEYSVFQDMEEAKTWLGKDRPAPPSDAPERA